MFLNNDFLILSIYGGPEWTLSSAAIPWQYKILKASERDRIFSTVVSKCYVWFGSLKGNEFELCHKRCKISCLWWNMRFSYTQSLSKPEFSEINKNMEYEQGECGKELFIRFTASVFRKLLSIYVFRYFFFWSWGQDVGSDCISSWSLLFTSNTAKSFIWTWKL